MKDEMKKKKNVFRFMFVLTVLALAAVVALIVFVFRTVDELGLWACLIIGVMMAGLIALTAITVSKGLRAYGKN